MKTDFLQKLIPETVEGRDAIIAKIFAENGKDIAAEQGKFADYDALKAQVAEQDATIEGLKAASDDAAALKAKITEYEAKEAERVAQDAKTARQRELAQRFATVRGAVEFVDPDIEAFVLTKFSAALDDAANKGKGDAEIYTALTKDKPFFKSQAAPPPTMGGVGDAAGVPGVTPEQWSKMGIKERTEFREKYPEQYNKLTRRS